MLLECCKNNRAFAAILKALFIEIQEERPFTISDPEGEKRKATQEALAALLAWLEAFKPDDACNQIQSSTSDNDNGNPPPPGSGAIQTLTQFNLLQTVSPCTGPTLLGIMNIK